MFFAVALIVAALDQAVKYLVRSNMTVGQTAPLLGDLAELCYVRNEGAAFDILEGRQTFLIAFTAAVILAIGVYCVRNARRIPRLETFSLALLCGGGLGNLVCRVLNGYVTDFINIHILPVFNIADICICCGCALLLVSVIFLEPRGKR